MDRPEGKGNALKWTGCPLEIASFVFFDVETTGLRPDRGARITEMAVVNHRGVRFKWECEGPGSGPLSAQLPALFEHLRAGVVVGHNIQFDLRFIAYEAERLGCEGPRLQFIDTLGLARKLLAGGDHQLGTLLKTFDITPEGELHTAITDARATRALFWELVDCGDLETLADAGLKQLRWMA